MTIFSAGTLMNRKSCCLAFVYLLLIAVLPAQPARQQQQPSLPQPTFTKKIKGLVLDGASGLPVPDAKVTIKFDPPASMMLMHGALKTDAQGRFAAELTGLAPFPDRFAIVVRCELLKNYQSEYFPGRLDDVQITLPAERVWVAACLLDRMGQPLPPEPVEIWHKPAKGADICVGSPQLDRSGVLVDGPFLPGAYYAKFTFFFGFGDKELIVPVATIRDLNQAESVNPSQVPLPSRLDIRVVDQDGQPLDKFRMNVKCHWAKGEKSMGTSELQASEFPSGSLPFFTSFNGRYRISAENGDHMGYIEAVVEDLERKPSRTITVTCAKGTAQIMGRVDGPLEAKQTEIIVEPIYPPSPSGMEAPSFELLDTHTDKDGRFSTNMLPPGRYRLAIKPKDGLSGTEMVITLTEGDRKEIVLSRNPLAGLPMDGQVVNHVGQPLEGATVSFGHRLFSPFKTDALGSWHRSMAQEVLDRSEGSDLYITYAHPDYVPVQIIQTISRAELTTPTAILYPPAEVDVQFVPAGEMKREPAALIKANPNRLDFALEVKASGKRWTFGQGNSQPEVLGDQYSFHPTLHQATLFPDHPILHRRTVPRGVPLEFKLREGTMGEITGQPIWLLDGGVVTSGTWTIPYALSGKLTVKLPVVMHPPDLRPSFPVHLRVVNVLTGKPMEGVWMTLNATGDNQVLETPPDGSCQFTYYPGESSIYVGDEKAVPVETSGGRIQAEELYFDQDPHSSSSSPIILKMVPSPDRRCLRLEVLDAAGQTISEKVTVQDRTIQWTTKDSPSIQVHQTDTPLCNLLFSVGPNSIEPVEVVRVEADDDKVSSATTARLTRAGQDPEGYPCLQVNFGPLQERATIECVVRLPNVKPELSTEDDKTTMSQN